VDDTNLLVQIKDLKTYFYLDEGVVHAVDGADFNIHRGKTIGIVGESGCGKSVTARSIMRIVPRPGRVVDGQILYHTGRVDITGSQGDHANGSDNGVLDLATLDPQGSRMRSIRGAEIAMVFQEPMTSLSPVHTIGNQIAEAILLHQDVEKEEAYELAVEMLDLVGMPLPSRTIDQYSYELSGGMRQRAVIAMALSCHPNLLIADEPTTALDVTTEAQILKLMRRLQDELGMAIMYITHNLGVIAQMAEYVVVMYMGKVVEEADVDTIFHSPAHPYTRALLQSIPRLGQKTQEKRRLASIRGMVPDPYALPVGCAFHPRCSAYKAGLCDMETPQMVEIDPGHRARCLRLQEIA
jgi:oligopeptide/dipeptide ABC transporter ATP-binding protein